MNAYNRILGVIISGCCLLLVFYFASSDSSLIKTSLEPWYLYFFFIILILLLIVSNRFKKLNDIRGRNLSYIAALSFVGIIFFPLFVFLFDAVFLGINLPDFILMIFPFIALVLSSVVVYRLFENRPMINSVNVTTEHPYK